MKISTKGRYALRMMLDLALHNDGSNISLRSIASRQQISDKYLEQIITMLVRAGFVRSTRGPQGGYRLSADPKTYTVGSILRLTEGSLAPVACLEENADACPRMADCRTLSLWQGLDKVIHDYLDRITIGDLMQTGPEGYDYVI